MSFLSNGAPRASTRSCRWTVACLALTLWSPAVAPGGTTAGTAAGGAPAAVARPANRVLILSSFGSGFGFYAQVSSVFRSELALVRGESVDFFEATLEFTRLDGEDEQAPSAAYLTALFDSHKLDLVVALGGPAAHFTQRYRERLFPEVPVLYAAVDARHLDLTKLGVHEAVVPVEYDLAAVPETVLQLLPTTENLAIVLGTSPVERFWRAQLEQALAPFEPRLHLIWLDKLSLGGILARVAALPPRSAVFFGLLLVDGAGRSQSPDRALAMICRASHSPIFGLLDTQLGLGVVGGRMMPMVEMGRAAAGAAARLLNGVAPPEVRPPPLRPAGPIFDGRELARFKIPESRLPRGSEVRFAPVSPWTLYRGSILGAAAVVFLQTALIAGLLIHRARRREAEGEVRSLHGRLLLTYEQERRRLARELHDDLTQRLARLAIDAAQVERLGAAAGGGATLANMREELVRLSHDVHTLSRQLHPSILDDLGLADALRSEAERFARVEQIAVDLRLGESTPALSADKALCLFRVAQEALRNVAHHAQAARVEVVLRAVEGNLELGVRDDGVGFDPAASRKGPGLGHVSLRERLHLVGGRLEITSAPQQGTIVLATVPFVEAAS